MSGRRTARVPSGSGDRQISWIIGTALILATTLVAAVLVPSLRHWFLVPVALCGILIAPDAVDWARGRLDTFDPQAMLGLLGLHFFYVGPLLHVTLDYWALYLAGSDDWRRALGNMAVLNLLGLILYRGALAPRITAGGGSFRPTDTRRLTRLAAVLAVGGALCFAALVASMGGPLSYLRIMADDRQQLAGLGFVLLISKMFPTAALIGVLIRYRAFFRGHTAVLFLPLMLYVLTEMMIGGLGGSRSHTVWSLVIGVGLCHVLIKPIRRSTLAALFALLVTFMYFYGFYKAEGSQAFQAISDGSSLAQLSSDTDRDLASVLLGDLGRADLQALLLERERAGWAPVAHGLTYIGDLTFLVPDHLGLGSIPDKVEAGTNMLYGNGTVSPEFQSSRVYGLAGEAVLNFGPAGAVLGFLPLAFVIRGAASFYRRCLASPQSPGMAVLAPGLSIAAALTLTSDVDNLAWFVLNYLFFSLVLGVASRSASRSGRRAEEGQGEGSTSGAPQPVLAAAPAARAIPGPGH
jgi:hypothetical protein